MAGHRADAVCSPPCPEGFFLFSAGGCGAFAAPGRTEGICVPIESSCAAPLKNKKERGYGVAAVYGRAPLTGV